VKQPKEFVNQVTTGQIIGLIVLAYLFSIVVRMIWVYQFQDNASLYWDGQLMINTNDGYFFASGAQKELFGMHADNPRVYGMWDYGVIFLTTLIAKITPFSLESIILYMPSVISSLVVVPVILIARLYHRTIWGFFSALLAAVAWSYYNRTMTGYYDTDMFSAMAPMVILYFLMKSTLDFNLRSALYASIAIVLYPFLYDQGKIIVDAMALIYAVYMIFHHHDNVTAYRSIVLVFLALIPFGDLFGVGTPYAYLLNLLIVMAAYFILPKIEAPKYLIVLTIFTGIWFLVAGDVIGLAWRKIAGYMVTGTKEHGLHFYAVNQTVREAGHIPFSMFAKRISGSEIGVILSLVGYVLLVIRHRAFLLALPLIGIGVFALFGGLRFTVYAVPVAAMSAVYLFCVIGDMFKDQRLKYAFVAFVTLMMLYPNIRHIIEYKVPTVLNKAEVEDLAKLDKLSDTKDYTLAWWDYGYPIWYYSDTNTLIDGGKHNDDNYIISKILQTSSPQLAANLSRLAVETYVDSNYSIVADRLFDPDKNGGKDPNTLLEELQIGSYPIPPKSREIYLYLPFRMMNIFPTVSVFGNLDLTTGKPLRKIAFYPTVIAGNKNGILQLRNGIVFDAVKGELRFGKNEAKNVKYFIVTTNQKNGQIALQTQIYHPDGEYAVIYMKNYGRVIVMDMETFRSMYVQMFILGKYDKRFFEPVVQSPYTRIYRLKR
jgi:undecaprenyl-diphosphooligosaccharide--protein glycosyltransferase